MSKRVAAQIRCPRCGHQFEANLYRTIWIEDPNNRKLVFDDEINVVNCPACKEKTRLEFPFLCTNVKEGIAVWYEPYHDSAIDNDIQQYREQMGADSFYARAPRVKDWDAFKAKVLELEKQAGSGKPAVAISPEMQANFRDFIGAPREQRQNPKTRYPKWLLHLRKQSNRLIYAFVPFALLSLLVLMKNRPSRAVDIIAKEIGDVLFAGVVITAVTYALLTVVHIAIVEAKPWRERSKEFRLWCFASTYWVIGVFAYMLLFEPYGGRMSEDELIHLFLVVLIPPLLTGSAK